jgi:hypothetical protein
MSATEAEMRKVARGGWSKFWIVFDLVVLIGLCALNQFLLLVVVPKFQQIFADALPGMQLSTVTEFIFTYRIALGVAILAWPVLAVLLRRRQKPYASLWINLGIIWLFLQIGITFYAIISPMIGLNGGLSDTK